MGGLVAVAGCHVQAHTKFRWCLTLPNHPAYPPSNLSVSLIAMQCHLHEVRCWLRSRAL